MTGCLRPTPVTNLPILAGIQPAELRFRGTTLSLARCAMEPGHLLHSTLTCSPGGHARHLTSRHPFVHAAQQLISSSDDNNRSAALWADQRWNVEWLENITKLHALSSPISASTLLEWPCQEQRGFGLTAPTSMSDVSAPGYTDVVWPLLGSVSVAQKNKPSTTLSSTVQSIDLPMEWMA